MRSHRASIAALAAAAWIAGCSPVSIVSLQEVHEGGRALSIAVASTDAKRMVVASESGGLFRTDDGGVSWRHLDGLPNDKTRDVAIAWLDPNTIIATTEPQYTTVNDGGIWRSIDGGTTWKQPQGWAPPPGPGCPDRPGAFGISHMPLTRTFFVGTDCGIAVSHDNGATWSHFVLDPAATGPDAPFQHRVVSLLVINRTAGVAGAAGGLFFLAPNGLWAKAQEIADAGTPLHGFAAPFWNGSQVFYHASTGRRLFLSTDGGASWSQLVDTPQAKLARREAFVRVTQTPFGGPDRFDLYWGDGLNVHRRGFLFGAPGTGFGPWLQLSSDHVDPSDVAFDFVRRAPILLASDGGVHLPDSQGGNWKLTGGGPGGFIALQVSDMTGQAVAGSRPHLDLYFGTQDNGFKASADGGRTWKASVGNEGRFLSVDPTSSGDAESRVTGLDCGDGCQTFMTGAHFAHRKPWPDAPQGAPGTGHDAPSRIIGDAYLQFAKAEKAPFDAFLTLSAGRAWTKAFSLPLEPVGPALFAGSLANPTVYQGVKVPVPLANGGERFGLFRVRNLAGQAVVTPLGSTGAGNAGAGNTGVGAFGSVRTPISRRVVFGADPADANHLIAADVAQGKMKFSVDGGDNWFPLSQLTAAVIDNGRFLFTVRDLSLATVIAWDPYDSCHILVGTMQNGVIRSTDGGNQWSRIPDSQHITSVSSFFFPPTGAIWVSTSGRGLWQLRVERRGAPGTCRFPQPPAGPFPGSGDSGTIGS